MKSRRVIIEFEIETDLPVKVLRNASIYIAEHIKASEAHNWIVPVERPKVNVIRPDAKPKRRKA